MGNGIKRSEHAGAVVQKGGTTPILAGTFFNNTGKGSTVGGWVAAFFLACEDFWRMFDHLFPAGAFILKVEISSDKLIPLFRPGSIHSGSVS